ncbi:tRNA pseudouridine(13) synthase TruD [Candidatus Woesearchaeota archaeon]|nr:tRNA pseudouridine(13) synthase TruD [Candidatus Woesearchaeota archaeon]
MYVIKEKPEDFIVTEIMELSFHEQGIYTYYSLKKRDYTTLDAVRKIAEHFQINPKFINVAGNKDKQGITTQHLSIKHGPHKDLHLPDIEVTYLGKGNERLNLGTSQGNKFEIMVRNAAQVPRQLCSVINYFDNQRFGKQKDNHLIGQLLVERKFAEVCGRLGLPVTQNNYISALRMLPKQQLRLYLHAYQGYLWNEEVREYISLTPHYDVAYVLGQFSFPLEKIPPRSFSLYGFANGHREFLFREFPELSQEGDERQLIIDVKDFSSQQLDPSTYKLMFTLPKGCYATVVIKSLFG